MKVNEIFCSLQGEGIYTGTPAVFLRLSGCNLRCSFCDTRHESFREMSVADIVREVSCFSPRHIVITGGEPSLQITSELTDALHQAGFYIQMETNGTCKLPSGVSIDWITCSPKGTALQIDHIDELKLLCHGGTDAEIDASLAPYASLLAKEYRLQPLDTGHADQNKLIVEQTIHYILSHPKWHLSLQTHKLLDIN